MNLNTEVLSEREYGIYLTLKKRIGSWVHRNTRQESLNHLREKFCFVEHPNVPWGKKFLFIAWNCYEKQDKRSSRYLSTTICPSVLFNGRPLAVLKKQTLDPGPDLPWIFNPLWKNSLLKVFEVLRVFALPLLRIMDFSYGLLHGGNRKKKLWTQVQPFPKFWTLFKKIHC